MTISVICEACGKIYSLKVEAAGETFVCQACGAEVDVPGGNQQETNEGPSFPSPGPGPGPTPLPRPPVGPNAAALARVKLPAILMMITAGISCITQPILMLSGGGILMWFIDDVEETAAWLGGTGGIIGLSLCMLASIIVLVGAWKMKNLRAYGFSVTAMLIGTFPCMSICCGLGFPIGIWGLVVLSNANVKAAFKSSRN